MILQSRVKELLNYDELTGIFTWKVRRSHLAQEGFIAGRKDSCGAIQISVDGRRYFAHHLAWLYVYGYLPDLIDHKNRDCSDNSISNLRLANNSQNRANSKRQSNNKSGFKGVCWHKSAKKFVAQINIEGKRTRIGFYDSPEDAHCAYANKMKEIYGEFAHSG